TALVFFFFFLNVKAYVYLLVALIAYAGYWLGFRAHIVPTRELVMAMGWPLKQFVAHFSPLPWVVFFLFGAALYRIRTRRGEIAMSLLFLAMIGLSFTLRPAFFIDPFELIFRGVPTYVLQTTAVGGLAFLALRRAWPDKPRFVIWRILDFAGRESFMFLILHYFLITLLVIVIMGARGQGHDAVWMTMYPRAAIIVVGTALLLPVAARLRDRVAVIPGFIPATLVALAVLGFASAAMNAPQLYVTARLAGFGAAFAFAFVFPSLRVKLRTHFSDPPPTPDAGAHG
ncbi:hypothetical protein KDL45_16405, partial [bacterium]|nr:hypothetical protein [bacterium]